MLIRVLGVVLTLLLITEGASAAGALGVTCSKPADCDSNHCVDGVCCSTACSGACESCSALLKASGKHAGTCGPTRVAMDPDNDCDAEPQATCGRTGYCDGSAAKCQLYPQGTSCGTDNLCSLANVQGTVCNGAGTCAIQSTAIPCGGGQYKCLPSSPPDAGNCTPASPCPGTCASPCKTTKDCAKAGEDCVNGTCRGKLPPGAACASPGDCVSGFCVEGVCCATACTESCESCAQPGKLGTCSVVLGQPVSPKSCGAPGPCQGSCAGQASCMFPGAATPCSTASCVGDALRPADRCDGAGKCEAATPTDCGDYSCDSNSPQCFTSCTTNAQCAGGAVCDTATSACSTEGASCADSFTVKTPAGTLVSCAPYRCVAGKCLSTCSGPADCAPGSLCDSSLCTAADGGTGSDAGNPGQPSSEDSGGCGCRVGGSSRGEGIASLLLFAFAVAARRRRPRHTRLG